MTAPENALLSNSKRHQSLAGYWFNEDDPTWRLNKNVNLNVDLVRAALAPDLRVGFTATLAFYAETKAAGTTALMAGRTHKILRTTGSSYLDAKTFINFRSSLNRRTEHYLGMPKAFFLKWHELGYSGISAEVYQLLKSWSLKGAIKGDAVKRLDPTQGPLTDIELRTFNEAAVRIFEKDGISLADLGIALLISNTGRRSLQITHMKNIDLDESGRNKKGEGLFLVRIPRAKQRGAGFRESFRAFSVSEELWVILDAQRKASISFVENCLERTLLKGERLALPLFPDIKAFIELHRKNVSLGSVLETDQLHLKSETVTDILKKIAVSGDCRSERTGGVLNTMARRFRYTIGTRAAREGLGPMIIAELLDQTDTQNARVYTKNVPENAAILDAKLSELMAPYVHAFQGVVIDTESEARRGDDLCSRVRFRGERTGVCGTYDFCGANVPIPCYTCIHFQALLDGPHEVIRDEMVAERKRILETSGDQMLAGANDRTILAVTQVIEKCRLRREELQRKAAS